jgi:hypothetical protein
MFGRSSTTKQTYTAITGQTAFAIQYDIGFVNVYVNGVRLQDGTDFAATTGLGITLTIPAVAGDIVQCESFGTFDVANVYTKAEANNLLASPALTGTPTAPTQAVGDNSTKLATTEFVKANIQTKLAPDGYSIITDNGIIKNQCTAWVILNATSSTILDSFNISSIVVVGSSYYYVDITFATPMDNMNYVVVGTANPNYGNGWSMPTFHDFRSSTTSKVRVGTSYQNSGILAETLSILIFGGKN